MNTVRVPVLQTHMQLTSNTGFATRAAVTPRSATCQESCHRAAMPFPPIQYMLFIPMNIQTNKLAASALCTLGHAGLWRGCGGGLTALSTYLNHDSPSGTQQHRLPAPNQTSRHPRGPLTLRQVTVKRKKVVIRVRFRFVMLPPRSISSKIWPNPAPSRAQPPHFFGSSDGARDPAAGTTGQLPCRRPPRRHAHLRQAQITPT